MRLAEDEVTWICRLVVDHELDTQDVADHVDISWNRVQQLAKGYHETDERPGLHTPGRKPNAAEYRSELIERVRSLHEFHEQVAGQIAHIPPQPDDITIGTNRVNAILQGG